jgi:hypothetical protein
MRAPTSVVELLRAAGARDDAEDAAGLLGVAAATSSVLAVGVVAASALLPDLFTQSDHPERDLWAACVAFTLLFVGVRRLLGGELGRTSLVAIVAGLGLLGIVRMLGGATWDYACYEAAGKAAAAGTDLYGWAHGAPTWGGTRYLYSPLLANLFAGLQRIPRGGMVDQPAFLLWTAVVYWAACAFVPLLMTALERVYGLAWPVAPFAAFSLGVFSTPALRTLEYSQPNAIVADCLLAWLLLSRRSRRGAAGSAGFLAFATILKTSPLVFFVLPIVERRWRTLAAGVAGCALLVVLSGLSIGARPWIEFLRVAPRVASLGTYRDNSFASFVVASARLMGFATGEAGEVGRAAGLLLGLGVLAFAAARSRLEWPWVARMPEPNGAFERQFPAVVFAMCLLSPLVWEHHWVWIALPCVLVTNAAIEEGGRVTPLVGTLLIFFVPTFDAFPFSYHRLVGALLVLAGAVKPPSSKR